MCVVVIVYCVCDDDVVYYEYWVDVYCDVVVCVVLCIVVC